jgi:hypothetical protein
MDKDENTSGIVSACQFEKLTGLFMLGYNSDYLMMKHHFTTALTASFIHVMEQGRIVECREEIPNFRRWTAVTRCHGGSRWRNRTQRTQW